MYKSLIVKHSTYRDSYNLMLLNNKLNEIPGTGNAAVFMGTGNNVRRLLEFGFSQDDLSEVKANDLCIGLICYTEEALLQSRLYAESFVEGNQDWIGNDFQLQTADTFETAFNMLDNPSFAMISIAGKFAVKEAEKAIRRGLHVFLFSDGISLEEEIYLKTLALEEQVLMMGPDCGTALIQGLPFGFANIVRKGSVGIIGASGTGMQEVMCLLDQFGAGISQAIGTGGRDLAAEVNGMASCYAIRLLAQDPDTEVLVFISKEGDPYARDKVIKELAACRKPSVLYFQGLKENLVLPSHMVSSDSLTATARNAFSLQNNLQIAESIYLHHVYLKQWIPSMEANLEKKRPEQKVIQGLYSGGTLAAETELLLTPLLQKSFIRSIDMGSHEFTDGRLHPIIDTSERLRKLDEVSLLPETSVILMDMVLGNGAHPNPAAVYAEAVRQIKQRNNQLERHVDIVVTIVGTDKDPQQLSKQQDALRDAGAYVVRSNLEAAYLSALLADSFLLEQTKQA